LLTEEDLLQLSGSETAHASPNASAVVLVLKRDMEPKIWCWKEKTTTEEWNGERKKKNDSFCIH